MHPGPAPSAAARGGEARRGVGGAAVLLLLAVVAAYAGSFHGPFVFDDGPAITDNPTLRHLAQWRRVLRPPHGGLTVEGRPVLNLSFALNYALGGTRVAGYHAANLLIHFLAGLALFGLVRRTCRRPRLAARWGAAARPLAFALAALWLLHPLQTEAVTYVVQRAESLMGLFYFLTLYGLLRYAEAQACGGAARTRWGTLAAGACLLGMGTKEVMVTAPVLALCYDRAFLAGSFREAWRLRRRLYLALAATWIPLAALVWEAGGNRGGTSGFGVVVSWWGYEETQCVTLVRYLALAVWPHPLVFEYGPLTIQRTGAAVGCGLVVLGLGAAALWALWRRPALGFLGLWFFGILAPTSLIPGPLQMVVEHRMYLPLAAVLLLIVFGVFSRGGRRGLAVLLAVAAGLGALTFRRNQVYRSEVALWQDTAAKRPESVTAHSGFGMALAKAGRRPEAIAEFQRVLQLRPDSVQARTALGNLYSETGRPDEGLRQLQAALRLEPNYPEARQNLGAVLDRQGRTREAVAEYAAALRIKPAFAEAHNDLSDALRRLGDVPGAEREARAALQVRPDYAAAHVNLAEALALAGRLPEARAEFAAGQALAPADGDAWHGWGNALAQAGQVSEALAAYAAAAPLAPADSALRYDEGNALAARARFAEAAQAYGEALRLRPDYPEAHDNLGNALTLLHRDAEAVVQYRESLRLRPAAPRVLNNRGLALARLGEVRAAAADFAAAVALAPDYREARENLARAQAQLESSGP